jgi:predicted outer membrane lipoprotein
LQWCPEIDTNQRIESLATAQAMIVALWTELVDDREGLDADALWQRATDAAEQVRANLADNQKALAEARAEAAS